VSKVEFTRISSCRVDLGYSTRVIKRKAFWYQKWAQSDQLEPLFKEIDVILRRQSLDGERSFKAYLQCMGGATVAKQSDLNTVPPSELFERVRRTFPNSFPLDEELVIKDSEAFWRICRLIKRIFIESGQVDILGYGYEYFFADLFKGKTGKYFTPRTVVDFCIKLACIRESDVVCDPTCGSGGFLARIRSREASTSKTNWLVGNDIDPILTRAASLNISLSGLHDFKMYNDDVFDLRSSFHKENDGQIDAVLANPPFSLMISDRSILGQYQWPNESRRVTSDQLFMESMMHLLKPGGRLITVLPHSIIANSENTRFREWLSKQWVELATISLPEGLFYPFGESAARACIVSLQLRGPVSKDHLVMKAAVESVGYDLKAKSFKPISQNDFQRILGTEEFALYRKQLNTGLLVNWLEA